MNSAMNNPPDNLVNFVRQRASQSNGPKTILLTGATSGIGLCAAKILRLANPRNRLILVARTVEKAEAVRMEVDSLLLEHHQNQQEEAATAVEILACDQSSLTSVREFVTKLRRLLANMGATGLDALCLNAAMMAPSDAPPQFTEDGIELTFQTNHLAPFLIANLIHDLINPGGRVIFTTSGLHAFVSFNGFRGIREVRKRFETIDGNDFHFKAAYSVSKLANTTCCLTLNRKLHQLRGRRDVVVNCFTPGLIPSTGLFRHSERPSMSKMGSTVEHGGGALAWMAMSDEAGQEGGLFYKTQSGTSHDPPSYGSKSFCSAPIPDDAANISNQELLWKISAELVGIDGVLKPRQEISAEVVGIDGGLKPRQDLNKAMQVIG